MSKYLRILLSDDYDDKMYKHLPFCYYLVYNNCEYAGYKQIEKGGLDADYLCSIGVLDGPTKTGSYKVIYSSGTFSGDTYYLNVEALFFEKDLAKVLKERNPVWLIPKEEFEKYDKNLYNCLIIQRKNIVNKAITGYFPEGQLPVQHILELQLCRQLKKAFEEGLYDYQPQQLKDYFESKKWLESYCENLFQELYDNISATKSKKEDVTTSVSNSCEEGSSTTHTN